MKRFVVKNDIRKISYFIMGLEHVKKENLQLTLATPIQKLQVTVCVICNANQMRGFTNWLNSRNCCVIVLYSTMIFCCPMGCRFRYSKNRYVKMDLKFLLFTLLQYSFTWPFKPFYSTINFPSMDWLSSKIHPCTSPVKVFYWVKVLAFLHIVFWLHVKDGYNSMLIMVS